MPWCEPCSRYFAPSAMKPDGTCPQCDAPIDVPFASRERGAPTLRELQKMSGEKAPWHFKLLMSMLLAYLLWRIVAPFVD